MSVSPVLEAAPRSYRSGTSPGRLLVVSNRVLTSPTPGGGGLGMAMDELLKKHGGVWAGWNGKITETPSMETLQRGNVSYLLHSMTEKEHSQFYLRFCNGTLWPILHYNINLIDFDREAYDTYLAVNRRYAETIAAALRPGDSVWVHDFHFIPLAHALRELGVRNRIGFFLHTPFAAREVLVTLPAHRELMSKLYAYDVVGFQTRRDLDAFREYAAYEMQAAAKEGRDTQFGHFPIGIHTARFANASRQSLKSRQAEDLKASLNGRQLILGVDRLDYSKGILQRLKAIEELLKSGRWRQQFTFLQIAPPTREGMAQFEALRAEVESLVGHINGVYTDIDWVPIRFLARGMRRDTLAGFYRMARICLVTPLRDGMNLVAKEFVAAQDPDDPGVLVLSRFAGAAEELTQALLINPYDASQTAGAIEQALTMPVAERKRRWQTMFDVISRQTLERWYDDFLAALAGDAAQREKAQSA